MDRDLTFLPMSYFIGYCFYLNFLLLEIVYFFSKCENNMFIVENLGTQEN